jgi:AcrR family transcriptional regulator
VEAGRDKILAAARDLLEGDDGEAFSIDAVARRAGVARMTIYNQFESKAGLLEELFDLLAERGAFGRMTDIFHEPDPDVALDAFVALFGEFWTASRHAHRKLRAAAIHDAELESAMMRRNERRRFGLAELVKRLAKERGLPLTKEETVNALFVLLSFDTFDALAGTNQRRRANRPSPRPARHRRLVERRPRRNFSRRSGCQKKARGPDGRKRRSSMVLARNSTFYLPAFSRPRARNMAAGIVAPIPSASAARVATTNPDSSEDERIDHAVPPETRHPGHV